MKLLASVVLFATIISCRQEATAPSSVKYIEASDKFSIDTFQVFNSFDDGVATGLNFYEVDNMGDIIRRDTLLFDASFNEEVSWTITIKSLEDKRTVEGPVKVISGTSNEIKLGDVFWLGDSDNIYFFRSKENISVELKVLGSEESVLFDGLSIVNAQAFEGVLAVDFEISSEQESTALITNKDNINTFFQNESAVKEEILGGKFVSPEELEFNLDGSVVFPPAPEPVHGYRYVYLNGKDDVGQDSPFYIGGFNNATFNFGLDGKAEDWYFNFFATSNGNPTSKVIVDIDGVGGDIFNAQRQVTWTGWKLVSVRLSDFIQSEAGALGGNGLQPNLIKNFTIGMHSGGGLPGNEAKLVVDYVIFTKGGPFSQQNIKK